MTRTFEPGDDQPGTEAAESGAPEVTAATGGDGAGWADNPGDLLAETADLIKQIRQLAAHDPDGVQQVVADVLNAFERDAGGLIPPATGAPSADSTPGV